MSLATLLALTLFLLPLQLSPGPANLYFAALAGQGGVRHALGPLAGYLGAAFVLTVLLGFGLDAAVFGQPGVTRAMQLAGAGYMLWLAWSLWRAAGTRGEGEVGQSPSSQSFSGQSPSARPGWSVGAAVLLLNPKAYLILALTLGQFTRGELAPGYVFGVAAVICVTYTAAFAVWAGVAAHSGRALGKRADPISALCIALAALWTLWQAFSA